MGIAPYKYFTYDGKSSRDYDVYLTGTGVFNAPERAVEMVEIPGRNGNYALDQGKFNNISVTYKAGIVDYSESNFADKVSAVRNWLCSKVGYKRLSDDYNPNEYRMAVYKSGVNIEHEDLRTGTFEITFDCKPQRWLTSGETAVTVANGGTLNNPTPFEAEPLLAVSGYGTIGFNGYEIEIENVTVGDTLLVGEATFQTGTKSFTLDDNLYNNGDTITVNLDHFGTCVDAYKSPQSLQHVSYSFTDSNSSFATVGSVPYNKSQFQHLWLSSSVSPVTFTAGTNSSVTNTLSGTWTLKNVGSGNNATVTFSITETISYTASAQTITFSVSGTATKSSSEIDSCGTSQNINLSKLTTIMVDSSKSALGNPTYIDCDIGECWMESGGSIVSLNGVIALGSDLPKLASGTNTFTYDNTVTELKVTPRWWKV